jgi:hypothetical protein
MNRLLPKLKSRRGREIRALLYEPGDGIFIPDVADHRHRGKTLTEKALIFFIEKI